MYYNLVHFVKDNFNLLSYNQWSGGEYLKNTNGLIAYEHMTLSQIFLDKYCFKIVSDGTQWGFADVVFNDFTVNSKVQATFDILTENPVNVNIYKMAEQSGRISASDIQIPASSTWQTYTLSSSEIPEDANSIRIRILQNNTVENTVTYLTNCKLQIIP